MSSGFRIVAFDEAVDRKSFECTNEAFNRYFQQQASQDIRRRVAFCFVASDDDGVIGYYTLASAVVTLVDLAPELKKKLPKYGDVPCVLLGRLAVDKSRARQGYGSALLADALKRALKAEIAAHAMLTDPVDAGAEVFYAKHGFIKALESKPERMFLSLVTAASAMQRAESS